MPATEAVSAEIAMLHPSLDSYKVPARCMKSLLSKLL